MLQEQLMHARVCALRADGDASRAGAESRVRKARKTPVVEIVESADGSAPRLILIRTSRA